jgi:pyruvate ferredoxin oxidoreductase alpha subunit
VAKTVALTGNLAVAEAMRQIEPDVVPAYPITPQTTVVEEYSSFVSSGRVRTEYINVESEHSAMSAAIGAAAAGARVITATSSQGLALMWEMLYIASGLRLPIVMPTATRALSAPINIHGDHSDAMGARDSGWIQLFAEDAQEAYDLMIQAVKIAENKKVRLPVMVNYDGFIISHAIARLDILEDKDVQDFIGGDYKPDASLLDISKPITVGAFDGLHGLYFEFKRQQEDAMTTAKNVIIETANDYEKLSGRKYGFFEKYKLDDAEAAILVMGSAAGTAKIVVDELRNQGKKVGLLKLRAFRPFPANELAGALENIKAVAVLDRSHALTGRNHGPLFIETQSALYQSAKRPKLSSYIFGLGGRDITATDIREVFEEQLLVASGARDEVLGQYIRFRG